MFVGNALDVFIYPEKKMCRTEKLLIVVNSLLLVRATDNVNRKDSRSHMGAYYNKLYILQRQRC